MKDEPIESRMSKDDTTQECWCGCGERTKPNRRWRPGHDQRAKGIIKRAVREGKLDELTDRQRDYAEERNLIEETHRQMERKTKAKRQEKASE